jgi:surface antigen
MINLAVNGATILGCLAVAVVPLSAQASTGHSHPGHHHAGSAHTASYHVRGHSHVRYGVRYAYGHHGHYRYAGISCVPFARAESGIILTGNAASWWDEAQGRYARGNAPEPGSVLNFRANGAMHLGHVAVVRDVVNSRQIDIDQANWWGPGGGHGVISRNVSVVDVSPHNDWTAVRVALGHSGSFGSVYPTYGFIYQRPDGTAPAATVQYASVEGTGLLNPAPRDLRPRRERSQLAEVHPVTQFDEVAEAPADTASGPLSLDDAPDHSLR